MSIPATPPIPGTSATSTHSQAGDLLNRFTNVRSFTQRICGPLETEDYVVQSMPDVSPTRWHLAHTTWFFETFVLKPNVTGYKSSNDAFEYLFNSYYNTVGKQFPREKRGLLSRPTVKDVWAYRDSVDKAMKDLLAGELSGEIACVVELGLQHEQQHQELMLTDIKHVLSCNPLYPTYQQTELPRCQSSDAAWYPFAGGVRAFGFDDNTARAGFCFDNELPRHEAILHDYQLQDRLATNRDYMAFVSDGGYTRPEFWLSMGWSTVQSEGWEAPCTGFANQAAGRNLRCRACDRSIPTRPVCHVSYFEADAFARWSGARLPTEFEWENAAAPQRSAGNFADSHQFHPTSAPASNEPKLRQFYGDVWEWTSSQYAAYPGYQPPAGALGEYNGKFMCNQFVLRGGSCATSLSHIRATYRNFFPPNARWQFTGIRLAK